MRLLNSQPEEVYQMFHEMAKESEALIDEVTDICWYMRGSLSWEYVMDTITYKERRKLRTYIEKLIERVSETKMPLL